MFASWEPAVYPRVLAGSGVREVRPWAPSGALGSPKESLLSAQDVCPQLLLTPHRSLSPEDPLPGRCPAVSGQGGNGGCCPRRAPTWGLRSALTRLAAAHLCLPAAWGGCMSSYPMSQEWEWELSWVTWPQPHGLQGCSQVPYHLSLTPGTLRTPPVSCVLLGVTRLGGPGEGPQDCWALFLSLSTHTKWPCG